MKKQVYWTIASCFIDSSFKFHVVTIFTFKIVHNLFSLSFGSDLSDKKHILQLPSEVSILKCFCLFHSASEYIKFTMKEVFFYIHAFWQGLELLNILEGFWKLLKIIASTCVQGISWAERTWAKCFSKLSLNESVSEPLFCVNTVVPSVVHFVSHRDQLCYCVAIETWF